jgi:hypothetical protein
MNALATLTLLRRRQDGQAMIMTSGHSVLTPDPLTDLPAGQSGEGGQFGFFCHCEEQSDPRIKPETVRGNLHRSA